jgi:hypothetical protein
LGRSSIIKEIPVFLIEIQSGDLEEDIISSRTSIDEARINRGCDPQHYSRVELRQWATRVAFGADYCQVRPALREMRAARKGAVDVSSLQRGGRLVIAR